jgi:MFS family permease
VTSAAPSAWAPLGLRLYRILWLAVLASNVGAWMETVGAQWLLVSLPHAAALVALVQVADTLPDLLLALPGGALADIFDRRWFLIVLQTVQVAVSGALTWLTMTGAMTPALLLVFTGVLGAAGAIATPAYQALIPDIVPRQQLPAAAALAGLNVNVARAVGPAIAGLVIAKIGVGAVFLANTVSLAFLPLVLSVNRSPAVETRGSPEPFLSALLAGGRYVRYSPVARRILIRLGVFIVPASGLWALLPVVATERLGLGSGGYGLLLGALGAGAIVGAALLSRIREHLAPTAVLFGSSVVYAVAMSVLVLVPVPFVAFLALVPAGMAWIAAIVTCSAEIQLFLPTWVRARGLATYQMVLFGGQALGALIWGSLAQSGGLVLAFGAASATLLLAAFTLERWPLFATGKIDSNVSKHWAEPTLAFEPSMEAGPVLVTTVYEVEAANADRFIEAMARVRLSRLRTGATSWELYREGETADRYLETYLVPSWEEHLRQHHGRQTGADAAIERAARALARVKPRTTHLFPTEPPEVELFRDPG